jgi:hypothetical protein
MLRGHTTVHVLFACASALMLLVSGVEPQRQASHTQDATKSVRITLLRQHSGADCTSGQLILEGKPVAYTLERPWQGNIPLISSIPAGVYHAS